MTGHGCRIASAVRLRAGDDRGSIMFAFLAIVIAGALGAMMLPSLITQDQSTHFDASRVRALHAAQAGVNVVLGEFRAATRTDSNGLVWGDDKGLPCYPKDKPLVGSGAEPNSRYSVWLEYWIGDPTAAGSTKMSICAPGYGPYDPTSGTRTPGYARVYSTGTDQTGGQQSSHGRTIVTTYRFKSDDINISGGTIRIFPDTSGNFWCMDAGSATPAAGTTIVLRACSTSNPPAPQQVFAYRNDLSIQLVSSVTATNANGLCLDTPNSPGTVHVAGQALVLKTCAIVDPTKCTSVRTCSPWQQQWSVDDNAHLEGAKPDKSNIDGLCINVATQGDGIPLALLACAGSVTDTKQTWVPSPTAGAGMAGASNSQLVNYKQFATCLDVTGQDPNSSFLIMYTCKQNPDPTKVAWNQKFTPSPALSPGPTKVLLKTTYSNGTVYCLTSPMSLNGYVRVTTPCPLNVSTAPRQYVWTVSQVRDATGTNDLAYADKYTVVDSSNGPDAPTGRCLGPGPNSDLLNGQYYKVLTEDCDGTTGQKWNADPSLDDSQLLNTYETEN
jgi:hypothetical protein